MEDLTQLKVESFLDSVADRKPTPGGGGATGLAGALACALARMVAAYSMGKKSTPASREHMTTVATKLQRLDQLLRALVTQDAIAYERMTAASASTRLAPKEATRDQQALMNAVLEAAAVPLEMAAIASNALATMDEFKGQANPHLLSDLGIAAVLAEAAARAAGYTVRVNAAQLDDADRRVKLLGEIDIIIEHCAGRLKTLQAFIRERLEPTSLPRR